MEAAIRLDKVLPHGRQPPHLGTAMRHMPMEGPATLGGLISNPLKDRRQLLGGATDHAKCSTKMARVGREKDWGRIFPLWICGALAHFFRQLNLDRGFGGCWTYFSPMTTQISVLGVFISLLLKMLQVLFSIFH
jgi:hypothetical protein